ncbi:hypothetical protein MMC24_000031 [Lignoscripta atroalba]|nr:hypothetical protein [Lignoscripta atroalba]
MSGIGDTGCSPYDAAIGNAYGYPPSLAAGAVFCALFTTSMIVHTIQLVWKRQWWQLVFSVGALAPCFFTAGCYIILGKLIPILGHHTSPLSPALYLWIFCTCDVVSIIMQGIGGGLASTAFQTGVGDPKTGTNIMVSGIVFQMASITVFVALFVLVLLRAQKVEGLSLTRGIKLTVGATTFAIALIYARSVYRTVELLQGWSGYLITHESYFIALDGTMMVLAVVVYNVLNPAWLLTSPSGRAVGEKRGGPVDTSSPA